MSIKNMFFEPIYYFSEVEKKIYWMKHYLENAKDNMRDYYMIQVCHDARNTVRYILMGYLIQNNKKFGKTLYLENLCKQAAKIDPSFIEIAGDCEILRYYTGKVNYCKWDISMHELINAIKSLIKIYHFKPIAKMRKLFRSEVEFDKFFTVDSIGYLETYIKKNENKLNEQDKLLSIKNYKMFKRSDRANRLKNQKFITKDPGKLMYDKIDKTAPLILSKFNEKIIKKIYLFGSYAYGKPNESSDFDILVVINNETDWSDTMTEIRTILYENDIEPLDLFVYNEENFKLSKNHNNFNNIIRKHGLLLYSAAETPEELFNLAKKAIDNINIVTESKIYTEIWKNNSICFQVSQFIENVLKGYLIFKGIPIEPKRNLDLLWENALKMNLLKDCEKSDYNKLKRYSGEIKSRIKTSFNDVKTGIKLLINIYNSLRPEIAGLCNLEKEVCQLDNLFNKGEYIHGNYN